MIALILITIFILIALGALAVGIFITRRNKGLEYHRQNDANIPAFTSAGIFTLLAVIFLAISCTTIVPARTVGVAVAFGKPVEVLENGFHTKAPWTRVEKFDLAIQPSTYAGDNAVDVRLANNAKARVDGSIHWQLKPQGMMDTYSDYREMDAIRNNVVDRNFRAALNEVMSGYDPLNVTTGTDIALGDLADQVKARMEDKVGDQIEIRSVTIPIVNFDEATQKRIDELQTEIANTRKATQQQETNKAISEANRLLEQSLSPEVLTDKCLDVVAASGQSPLGCFPGTDAQPLVNVTPNNQ